ncbi:MAG: peptide chain release factor 1 [bacterium]
MEELPFAHQLDELEEHFEHLQHRLSAPDELAGGQFQELSRDYSQLKPIVELYRKYRQAREELEENQQLLAESSGDMAELAREEVTQLEEKLEQLEKELKDSLVAEDPDADRNVILEIRAGTGGDEAALFAADLFRMYSRYAGSYNWTAELIDLTEADHGGYKQAFARIKGKGAYGKLKYESGIHRVQRVPETESSGRIHTSAATVAILPEAKEIDVDIDQSDLKIDTYRASGAGGQHVNKTDSAVRITHEPSGIVVQCQDERSQHKNRAQAMRILRSRLYQQARREQEEERRQKRRDQVGSGDRSGKIRTYNFPQNRVTDHRIDLTVYNLEEVMDGQLDEIIKKLREDERLDKLKELEESDSIAELVG